MRLARWLTGVAVVLAAGTVTGSAVADPAGGPDQGAGATRRVIVMGTAGAQPSLEHLVTTAGGRIRDRLPVINGFVADVPAAALPRLAVAPGVISVTSDRAAVTGQTALSASARTSGTSSSATSSAAKASATKASGKKSPAKKGSAETTDTGAMSAVTQMLGARTAWQAGDTGQGVDVALIDTGIAPVPGLDAAGKVVVGPDLSFDASGAQTAGLDAFGHGTFMAGIIAGMDAGAPGDPAAYSGVAPGARLVNVKVGAADGAADVSQVIAGIDWVTQHAHDPGLNIRVLNLSFGTDTTQDYRIDPLAQAAEQAWRHGIVVVAAAGNDGKPTHDLADPAADPYLLAIGGDDPNGTLDPADDTVASFAQHGTNHRPVDVIAPATHLLGLRVPGSFIDSLPTNTGRVGERYQRGSGTSEAAAVVSGLAALLVQHYPAASPDAIKELLTSTATPVLHGNGNPNAPGQQHYSGHGLPNLTAALTRQPGSATQTWPPGTGTGSLNSSRGSEFVSDNGVDLTGERDIFGRPYDSASMAVLQASASAWSGGVWNGSRWTGDGWQGSRWTGCTWTGTDWAGSRWTGSRWTGMSWTGSRWTGTGWNGSRWTGSRWTGSRWSTASWN